MKYFVVDVFTDKAFGGNPAGVCLLDEWLPDETLQNIAMENNLSETAFLIKQSGYYELRWFTPEIEIDLCGHATMGSAYILFKFVETKTSVINFHTQSGVLTVNQDGNQLRMDFPSRPAVAAAPYKSIKSSLDLDDFDVYKSADVLVVIDSEETLMRITPDFEILKKVKSEAEMPSDNFGVIVTAPGSDCDFVSRFFAPNAGVNEDPVTGRAHCILIPFWSKRLNKTVMTARQLSKRGGRLWCENAGNRVIISGEAVLYLTGEIHSAACAARSC
jgi:PhzF family phenazine biosynthesis protein